MYIVCVERACTYLCRHTRVYVCAYAVYIVVYVYVYIYIYSMPFATNFRSNNQVQHVTNAIVRITLHRSDSFVPFCATSGMRL